MDEAFAVVPPERDVVVGPQRGELGGRVEQGTDQRACLGVLPVPPGGGRCVRAARSWGSRPPWSARSFPAYGAYTASKGAVEAITLILARELRGRDVTVNTVAPGPTATDLFLEGKTPEQIDALAKAPALERLGAPEDIAEVVAFLTGPEGHWVNGQILRANGGLV
ncbi:hypothetical protein SHIRM173S_09798 [Streptomyces hirsutus]